MGSAVTAYGAPADDLRAAAAPLRALASRLDYPLQSVDMCDPRDLAAAVVGADGWAHSWGTGPDGWALSGAASGAEGAAALARVLARAAGSPAGTEPVDHLQEMGLVIRARAKDVAQAAVRAEWLARSLGVTGGDMPLVVQRAASDLMPAAAVTSRPLLGAWIHGLLHLLP